MRKEWIEEGFKNKKSKRKYLLKKGKKKVKGIGKTQKYYLANERLFNYLMFRQVNGEGAQIVNKLRGIDRK